MNTRCYTRKRCWVGDLKQRVIPGLIAILYTSSIYACSLPPIGTGWDKNRLIDFSPKIFLVKVESIEKETGFWFIVLEIIKYDSKLVKYYKNRYGEPSYLRKWNPLSEPRFAPWERHNPNDFNLHKEQKFWQEFIGRSQRAFCWPQHTFRIGETYLLFPDALGSSKAAEIIRSKKDRWYLYVKNRVKNIKSSLPKPY